MPEGHYRYIHKGPHHGVAIIRYFGKPLYGVSAIFARLNPSGLLGFEAISD